MDRYTFESMVNREIRQAVNQLLPQHTLAGEVSRDELHRQLRIVSERVQKMARDYYLNGLRTVEDVADELGVNAEHLRDMARERYFRYGIGHKFGDTWVWTPDEVDVVRPHGE